MKVYVCVCVYESICVCETFLARGRFKPELCLHLWMYLLFEDDPELESLHFAPSSCMQIAEYKKS